MRQLYLLALCLLFISTVNAQADIAIGSGSSGNSSVTFPCPLQDYSEGSRMQFLYRSSELAAAGMQPGNITAIKFNVLSVGGAGVMEQLSIIVGSTSSSSLATNSWDAFNGSTVTLPAVNYQPVVGLNSFTLPTPFAWNGTDNIMIEICNGDPNNGTTTTYTQNPVIAWTTGLLFNGSHSHIADNSGNLCGNVNTTNIGSQDTRPNIVFTWNPNSVCTSPPTAGTVASTSLPSCSGNPFTLILSGATFGTGQTYQWQSSPDGTSWTDIASATASSYTGNQISNTYYRAKLTCGGNTSITPAFLQTTVPCYCSSIPTSTADEEIFSVTVNAATNAYNCATVAPGIGSILNRYSNFNILGPLTSIVPGTTVPFTIQEDECDGPAYHSNGCSIWIDFNQNGVFTDPGEQVYVETVTTQSPRTISGSFVVPLNAVPGWTGMRIIVAENNSGSQLQPCMSYTYGETEDYLVNILPSTPCSGTPSAGNAVCNASFACNGQNFNLTLANSTLASGITYQWQSSPDSSTWTNIAGATNFGYTTNQNSTTYYRCVVTCSTTSASATSGGVKVVSLGGAPAPVITSSPADTVCAGTTVTLTTPACSGCTFNWSTGATTNSITVNTSSVFTVNVTNACGNGTATKEIVYTPSPSLSINGSNSICNGSSTTLIASGANTYIWTPATGLNTTTGPSVNASPTSTTTYTVTGAIGNCSQSMSVTVTVNAIPSVPTVTATGPTTFCQGDSVKFTSSVASGNQWFLNGNAINAATLQNYFAKTAGSYTVKTTANGCSSNASAAQTVTVNATPAQPTITLSGNNLQSSATAGNQWFLNGAAITGATSQNYSTTAAGLYSVQVTLSGCLSPMSTAYQLSVTGFISPVLDAKIKIAPNPVQDKLSIKYNGNPAKFTAMVISSNGVILSTGSFTTNYEIDMNRFGAGVYVVRIVNDKTGERTQRLIVKQ